MTARTALRSSWSTSRTRPTRLIIPITTALGAFYLTLRYGAFPGTGDVPVLDLEDPLAYSVLRAWCYAAPACVTLSFGGVIVPPRPSGAPPAGGPPSP